jgi:hypothetical protein
MTFHEQRDLFEGWTMCPDFVPLCITLYFVSSMITKFSVWWREDKNNPNVAHACRKRRLKWVPSVWGYGWVSLYPGVTNTEAWSSWGLGVGLIAPSWKHPVVRKSKEGYGPEMAVIPMMTIWYQVVFYISVLYQTIWVWPLWGHYQWWKLSYMVQWPICTYR